MVIKKKSYLHVDDCIRAIDLGVRKFNKKVNIINLGTKNALQ